MSQLELVLKDDITQLIPAMIAWNNKELMAQVNEILPQLKSVTASVVILAGIHCWNDYQFSLYILQSSGMRTVTLAISSFFSQTTSNLNAASAAAFLAIMPVVVCFLFLQKYFIKGMVDSAVK